MTNFRLVYSNMEKEKNSNWGCSPSIWEKHGQTQLEFQSLETSGGQFLLVGICHALPIAQIDWSFFVDPVSNPKFMNGSNTL